MGWSHTPTLYAGQIVGSSPSPHKPPPGTASGAKSVLHHLAHRRPKGKRRDVPETMRPARIRIYGLTLFLIAERLGPVSAGATSYAFAGAGGVPVCKKWGLLELLHYFQCVPGSRDKVLGAAPRDGLPGIPRAHAA